MNAARPAVAEFLGTGVLLAVVAGSGIMAERLSFTASTSFANPAVTTARTLTDTFTGIAPANVPLFLTAQLAGPALGIAINRFFHGR